MANLNQVISIYTESNPNPNTLKFVANKMLMPEGISRDYTDVKHTQEAPLAQALFEQFEYVKGVFYMSNFITITKEEAIDWFEVKASIQSFIKDWLSADKKIITEEVSEPEISSAGGTDTEVKIQEVLDEYIKPAVEMDGGAIKLSGFNDGVVTVMLQGSCSGCPSSTITLKNGIENLLKRMVPEVTEVVAEEG